ncbi:hypothetical protein CCMSSC00406_0002404 [Pleurotus cornucopiae]|uniref:Uncharacterized protein n=1 Tax=Pleurotus cornucopiae TaxID=5321 RepID=A0ACB7ITQ2_PLECO|nr:hypothetical protein CCMSSC00406_0002404 [Pleurotus cornucopiae]
MASGILTIDNLLLLICVSMLHKTFFERTIVFRVFLYKILLCALSLLHIASSASASLHSLHSLSPHPTYHSTTPSTPSPTLALGALASLLSAFLRRRCFAALGRLFDFQATLKVVPGIY